MHADVRTVYTDIMNDRPRASVIAERLWSSVTLTDPDPARSVWCMEGEGGRGDYSVAI